LKDPSTVECLPNDKWNIIPQRTTFLSDSEDEDESDNGFKILVDAPNGR
jgi:hypothetical protein